VNGRNCFGSCIIYHLRHFFLENKTPVLFSLVARPRCEDENWAALCVAKIFEPYPALEGINRKQFLKFQLQRRRTSLRSLITAWIPLLVESKADRIHAT
jgi:hypothetical protein